MSLLFYPESHLMNPQAGRPQAMTEESPEDAVRACLSALSDGQVDDDSARLACDAWRDDVHARHTWHAYQLIGDVLRSEELATPPDRDAAFLNALRSRLQQEPVVFAPQPLPRAAGPRRPHPRWLAPAAAAAGFMAVAGVLVVTRMNVPDAAALQPVMAGSPASASSFNLATGPAVVPSSPAGAAMLRDAELDAYLNAHQSARRTCAMTLPGSGLRSVEVVIPAGRQP
jgi:sigma-E factor negative regulatory protein RseA